MRRLVRFLTAMDASMARATLACLAMLAAVALIFVLGKFWFGPDAGALEDWFASAARSPWALPVTILAFTALAFLGAPQFLLIAAAVVAFGPWTGAAWSWIATMISGAITFWLGRISGAPLARRYGGEAVDRMSRFVGRNGFWSAFAIRNVPSAPFIVVNMGLGMSHIGAPAYLAGTGLGIVPKIALVAFTGKGVSEALLGADIWGAFALVGLGLAVWLGAMLAARRFLKRRERRSGVEEGEKGP